MAERLQVEHVRKQKEQHSILVNKQVSINEDMYADVCTNPVQSSSPLLLDSVVTPIQEELCTYSSDAVLAMKCKDEVQRGRQEHNQALHLARQHRNMAEESLAEKRMIKSNLEDQIEVVGNFWRNKIIEGNTRSGRILRAALIRK